MKKVGKQVLMLETDENNSRNGEGAFLRLKDGRILYAYSKFGSGTAEDYDSADIAAVFSVDDGETWGEHRVLIKCDADKINLMCVSLLRMENGDLGLFALCNLTEDTNDFLLWRSANEGETWSEPTYCINAPGKWHCVENQRVIRLKSGRIIIPTNYTPGYNRTNFSPLSAMVVFASDDDGTSWYKLSEEVHLPTNKNTKTGLQESAFFQRDDGVIVAYSRTDRGCQYRCESTDDGKTWSEPYPDMFFTSPEAPIVLLKGMEAVYAVFNPTPVYTGRVYKLDTWGRTPFILALSHNDGDSFEEIYCLEDSTENGCCYGAIFEGEDYLLVSYYHQYGTNRPLRANKMIKIQKSELTM